MNEEHAPAGANPARPGRLVRVANADGMTFGLLREWLQAAGYRVASGRSGDADTNERAVVTIVDVPFSRHGAAELLERVARDFPDEPMVALSATFFSNVSCGGPCARRLGVAGVLPKPVARDVLLAAIERFAVQSR